MPYFTEVFPFNLTHFGVLANCRAFVSSLAEPGGLDDLFHNFDWLLCRVDSKNTTDLTIHLNDQKYS